MIRLAERTTTVGFESVLFLHADDAARARAAVQPPSFFQDLHLDQIVSAVTSRWKEYDLVSFFYTPLQDPDAIAYRQEVIQDLEDNALLRAIESFSEQMRTMHSYVRLSNKLDYRYEKERWLVGAIQVYCETVKQLSERLRTLKNDSRALRGLRSYLATYISSESFEKLRTGARDLVRRLSSIRYCLLIRGSSITVLPYDNEIDYSVAVERTFEKFRRGAVKDYLVEFPPPGNLSHVEAKILERVALLNPAIFHSLESYCSENSGFLDATIARFEREVQFYVAYLRFIEKFREVGLKFCFPSMSAESKEIHCRDGFDLALAAKLIQDGTQIVCNDFYLRGPERVFVVSGPNQGGKTTFARMFGQLHYLAGLGCPVPGSDCRLFVCDNLFVHFEREEDIRNLRGNLEDDLVRARHILDQATPNSIVILNEIFASTTLKDAIYLSNKVMTEISKLDLLAVWVTFLVELSSFDEKTVSMVSMVDPEDPTVRTFKIERRSADGLAYAMAIAEKYDVTYDSLMERIKS
jgi:DNA mismatch repair protein MutS